MRANKPAELIEHLSMPEPNSGCHIWLGTLNYKGYGIFKLRNRQVRAHRVAYALAHGPVPRGMVVCHRCDMRWCVNPGHLFLGTVGDNNADMVAKGRQVRGETNGKAKLTERLVLQIFHDRRSTSAIGRALGINRGTITHIKLGRTWRHVTGAVG